MGDSRRDKNLYKLTISEDTLTKIDHILEEVEKRLLNQNAKDYCFLSFLIRYDDKGYRVFSFVELITHFKEAEVIERISLRLDVNPSMPSGMSKQEIIDIHLSSLPEQNSYFAVEGSDLHWVNSTFTMIDDVFAKYKSRYSWIGGNLVRLGIQIIGVVIIFIICLIASKHFSQFINIENPIIFTFLFFFLILSNTWTYISPIILNLVFKIFPNIHFRRNEKDSLLETAHKRIATGFITLGGILFWIGWDFIKDTLQGFLR